MKKFFIWFAAIIVSIIVILTLVFFIMYNRYSEQEERYQTDADIVRLHHLDYYARLLEEYKEKAGTYPFQYLYPENVPVYSFIMTDEQEFDMKQFPFVNINDYDFFAELERVLDREIDEKYDPQRVSSNGCPVFYTYMVNSDRMYFAIHLRHPNDFTRELQPEDGRKITNCYKMELSNFDDEERKYYTYNTIKENQGYQNAINTPITSSWFLSLEKKNRKNSLINTGR